MTNTLSFRKKIPQDRAIHPYLIIVHIRKHTNRKRDKGRKEMKTMMQSSDRNHFRVTARRPTNTTIYHYSFILVQESFDDRRIDIFCFKRKRNRITKQIK